jgi:hypothetical protein
MPTSTSPTITPLTKIKPGDAYVDGDGFLVWKALEPAKVFPDGSVHLQVQYLEDGGRDIRQWSCDQDLPVIACIPVAELIPGDTDPLARWTILSEADEQPDGKFCAVVQAPSGSRSVREWQADEVTGFYR